MALNPATGARRGRPPKPTALKILHGDETANKRKNEPMPSKSEIVAPEGMTRPALALWEKLAPDMIRTGTLTSWDVNSFGEFCESLVLVRLSRVRAMQEVTGKITPGPGQASAVTAWVKAIAVMNTLSSRFGMTPGDRARLATSSLTTGVVPGNMAGQDLLSG